MRLWLIRLTALVGLILTGYLTVQSFGAVHLAGCGAGSGCDAVLGSGWSRWFAIPVAGVGVGLWAVILVCSFIDKLMPVLVSAAMLAGGAAVWFVLIQWVKLEAWCAYCMAAHGCAWVLVGFVVPSRAAFTRLGTVGATLGLAGLILGQTLFPSASSTLRAYEADDPMLESAPVIGDPQAEHVLVMYFDYTCPHCRRMHRYMDQAKRRYGGQIALAMAPTPMDADCNPAYQRTAPRHENACELASLALAVWNAQPAQFEPMNQFLFQGDSPPSLKRARGFAVNLIGEEKLERALAAPFTESFLKAKIKEHRQIGKRTGTGGLLPMVVSSDGFVLIGRAASPAKLFETLESELGIKPVESGS